MPPSPPVRRDTIAALEMAARRIEDFHRRQKPENLDYTDAAGVRLGYRWTALEAAGLYVPGGTASYPSSVLMNAIPAKVAGVERMVMVVPTPDGKLNPLVLAAARIAGVDEIYRVGGAQAVGALAYGTETIRPVDKIVGPGNAYVAAAKRQVFGTVGIDMIAGPSEILVISDNGNDPAWIAADLLSQAEHDTAAQSILITDDAAFAKRVLAAVETHLQTLPRAAIARESWDAHGAVILVPHPGRGHAAVDRIAPEHLELAVSRSRGFAGEGPQCRRHLPGPLYARGGRRLCRRAQPCAADRAHRPLLLGPGRAGLHETHLDPGLRRRGLAPDRSGRRHPGRRRRALSAHALSVFLRLNQPRKP